LFLILCYGQHDSDYEALEANLVLRCCPSVSIVTQSDIPCFGFCDASSSVMALSEVPYNFTWLNSSGSVIQIDPTVLTSFSSQLCAGQYSVLYEDTSGFCPGEIAITIHEAPPIEVMVDSVIEASLGMTDGSIHISVSGGTPEFTYDIGNGEQLSGSFWNLGAGTFTITLTDAHGCQEDTVIIVLSGPVSSKTSLEYNGHWRIYPNPANSEIHLNLFDTEGINFRLIDAQGKVILDELISDDQQIFNVTDIASGVYTALIQRKNQGTFRKRLVIH
jgi:hypothetical protein